MGGNDVPVRFYSQPANQVMSLYKLHQRVQQEATQDITTPVKLDELDELEEPKSIMVSPEKGLNQNV